MKNNFILFLLLMCVASVSLGQKKSTISSLAVSTNSSNMIDEKSTSARNCGSMSYLQSQLKKDPMLSQNMAEIEKQTQEYINANPSKRGQAVTIIPVVFHVVYKNQGENVSQLRLNEQITVLNQDFRRTNADASNTPSVFATKAADSEIEFCLAKTDPQGNPTSGITRTSTVSQNFSNADDLVKFTSSGGQNIWDRNKYLNIWVCDLEGTLLGYAQFPGGGASTDGVVIDYKFIGKTGATSPFNGGRTATHEVGHWLNLRHIWGDALCGNDQVNDTPTQEKENTACPTFPHVSNCSGSAPNGDMFMNYMDYVDDDCMNMFTTDQKTRMQAVLNGPRATLKLSDKCSGTGIGSCDTSTNYSGTATLYTATDQVGYVAGHNGFLDKAKVDRYVASGTQVEGAFLYFGLAKFSNSTTSIINVSVWDATGPAGSPGTRLGTKSVTISSIVANINASQPTYVDFDNAIPIAAIYYLGIEITYKQGDTVALITNRNGDSNPGTAWEKFNDNTWHDYSSTSSWAINVSHAIYPIVCTPAVGLENKLDEPVLSIFPNPVSGMLNINTDAGIKELYMTDMMGKHIQVSWTRVSENLYSANLENLPAGIYLLQSETQKGLISDRVIKVD